MSIKLFFLWVFTEILIVCIWFDEGAKCDRHSVLDSYIFFQGGISAYPEWHYGVSESPPPDIITASTVF